MIVMPFYKFIANSPSHTHMLSGYGGEVLISVFGLGKSLHPSPNPFGSI